MAREAYPPAPVRKGATEQEGSLCLLRSALSGSILSLQLELQDRKEAQKLGQASWMARLIVIH